MRNVVKTEYGLVRGTQAADPRITVFKGVPFAAPPVGKLRWRAPQKAKAWDGIRDCLEFAPISMQPIPGRDRGNIYSREWNVDPEIPMSEDCLYLNVWTPAKSEEEQLPVFVWYFGGGLQVGNTAEMEFDGERLARRGIVVVTVNYRVNVFGFLAHPELTAAQMEAPTNFGSLDQQFGLMWTVRNIRAFGGDPENITIGGQSAGGGSVMTQLNCKDNLPYIKRAIIESGVFYNPANDPFTRPLRDAQEQGVRFLEMLGVSGIEEARALPAEVIRDKCEQAGMFWGTVSDDGVFQNGSAWSHIKGGTFPDVPLLLGYTSNEFLEKLNYEEGGPTQEELKHFWDATENEQSRETLAAQKGETINTVELSVRLACRQMEKHQKQQPNYVYLFDADIPGWDNPGAFHSSDLWFFFETLAKCWRPFTGKHYDLARQMCNYWTSFIRTGNPNCTDADGSKQEHWTPYTEDESNVMIFGETPKSKPLRAPWATEKLLQYCMKD
jgi:para-nitrobenzyl esterase